MQTDWATVTTDDGPMQAYVATPDGDGPHPGVLVLQEAFGVNRYLQGVAAHLAEAGFVAFAPELFHRSGSRVLVPYDDIGAAIDIFARIDNAAIETDIAAAVAALRARPDVDPTRIGVVGFCMGGFSAILAGLTTDVRSVVAFYPGGLVHVRPRLKLTPLVSRMHELRPATLCLFGGEDQGIPAADVTAIREALDRSGAHHEVVVYPGAKHGFHTEDRATAYDACSAEQAWQRALSWFERSLAPRMSAG